MAKNPRGRGSGKESLTTLVKGVGLLRAEIRVNHEEIQRGLTEIRDEMRTGFDQLYRHVDGFMKLHETLDIEMKVLKEQMNRLEDRVKRLEPV